MPTNNLSIGQEDIFTQVRAFILSLLGDLPVIQGLGNGVPTPLGDFVVMTSISQKRLSTNFRDYTDYYQALMAKVVQPVEHQLQIDCFGDNSGDYATILATAWRDLQACEVFSRDMQPLYCDDPRQVPFEDGEQNYTKRWTSNFYLQVNGVVKI